MPTRTVKVCQKDLTFGRDLFEMRPCNGLLDDPVALARQLQQDGYLLIRGLHDREAVLNARRRYFTFCSENGHPVAPGTDLMEGVVNPQGQMPWTMGNKDITHTDEFLAVLEGDRAMNFFARLFGEKVITFDYKWLRAVNPGGYTGFHFDNVYMSRGSQRLLTMWTPFGDIPVEQGTLLVCEGSNHLPGFAKARETYGHMDVDRDRVGGWFTNDPFEVTSKFGGRWVTSDFQAGDVVVIPMFTMHGSTDNMTNRWRLSCDTRFQPAADPADERWVGENPKAHYAWWSGPQKPMEVARAEWGI